MLQHREPFAVFHFRDSIGHHGNTIAQIHLLHRDVDILRRGRAVANGCIRTADATAKSQRSANTQPRTDCVPRNSGRSTRIEGRQKLPSRIRHKYTEEEISVYAQSAPIRAGCVAPWRHYGTTESATAPVGSVPVATEVTESSLPAVVVSKLKTCISGEPPELTTNRYLPVESSDIAFGAEPVENGERTQRSQRAARSQRISRNNVCRAICHIHVGVGWVDNNGLRAKLRGKRRAGHFRQPSPVPIARDTNARAQLRQQISRRSCCPPQMYCRKLHSAAPGESCR